VITESVDFGSPAYWILFVLLLAARAADLLSTRAGSPNLVLEANPLARRMGWFWGTRFNLVLCFVLALEPSLAIILMTISLLVAARNFSAGWLMRALGETGYRHFMSDMMRRTTPRFFALCVAGETLPYLLVGAAIICFSRHRSIPESIGVGMVAYGGTVAFYPFLSLWRNRRNMGESQRSL
jgi:hypothetical protein